MDVNAQPGGYPCRVDSVQSLYGMTVEKVTSIFENATSPKASSGFLIYLNNVVYIMLLRITGFAIMLLSVFGGFVLASGKLLALWQPPEIIIIVGAATGAFIISNPASVQRMTLVHLKYVLFKNKEFDKQFFMDLLALLFRLMDQQRRKGQSAIEDDIEAPDNSELFLGYPRILSHPRLLSFITDNFRITGMGNMATHALEGLMDHEIHTLGQDLGRPAKALQAVADACPGFGIVAAVMGIVVTMSSMGGPVELIGMKVAAALVGTFLGILLCYGVVGPLASAVEHTEKNEMLAFDCIKVALVTSQSGQPAIIAVDAGRRTLYKELRPTFAELETLVQATRETT
ncbi:flagellar motor stator protein MotA [Endozoicomonas sp.]|uniref:flagellar motor stator protein MotA n=1 Tax=Endozoicomonas sp. TaxID=1892382 RepID=UPI002886E49A|nr:flagellar motor stator protein MotA [Endozoicomonas sp.]